MHLNSLWIAFNYLANMTTPLSSNVLSIEKELIGGLNSKRTLFPIFCVLSDLIGFARYSGLKTKLMKIRTGGFPTCVLISPPLNHSLSFESSNN